jgi:hypothetical protein
MKQTRDLVYILADYARATRLKPNNRLATALFYVNAYMARSVVREVADESQDTDRSANQ